MATRATDFEEVEMHEQAENPVKSEKSKKAEKANPWEVENLEKFLFLNCPECRYKTKKKKFFHRHAMRKHPKSAVLFEKAHPVRVKTKQNYRELLQCPIF